MLRFDDDVLEPPGPAEGTIPDLCRRVLGLPTAPAPSSTAALWTAMWLDRLVDRWAQPDRRADLLSSWAQVAILHPAVHAPSPPDLLAVADPASLAAVARPRGRRRLARPPPGRACRSRCPTVRSPAGIARWMDDGFFARWTIGAFPPIHPTALTLRDLLGAPLGSQLLEAIVAILDEP